MSPLCWGMGMNNREGFMRKHLSTIILVGIFFIGLSVLLYPTISNYWNNKVQTKVVANYDQVVEDMSSDETQALLGEAQAYNERLRNLSFPLTDYKQAGEYESVLAIPDTEIMGYIDIEKIKVELPIYHGISPAVLNVACGHLPGSSLPIGGLGTHAVLSAHRGLPSAKLFTDLDQLVEGDIFTITVLKQKITYEVDQILIVEPKEVQNLTIEKDKDYCTLLTCTPYGINTHRLLVRGHRIDNIDDYPKLVVPNDAIRIDPLVVAPVVAVPMLLILLIWMTFKYRHKKSTKEENTIDKIFKSENGE